MNTIIAVAAGGAIGSVLLHGVNHAAARWIGTGFPWGTFLATVFSHRAGLAPESRALLAAGFLGGLTTFSAFSFDFAQLLGQGQIARAALYLGASLLLAILGFYLGAALTKLLLP